MFSIKSQNENLCTCFKVDELYIITSKIFDIAKYCESGEKTPIPEYL